MIEYDFVETITKRTKTDIGIQGVLQYDVASEILKKKAKEGWRVHTFFPDDRGTCLLEREIKNFNMETYLKVVPGEIKEALSKIEIATNLANSRIMDMRNQNEYSLALLRVIADLLSKPFWKRKQPDGKKQPLG